MIREIDEKDFEFIAAFLSEFTDQKFSINKYLKDFDYWWKQNPSYNLNDVKGWIIEDNTSKNYVKGFLGNIPIEYELNDNILKTFNASTWYIHPEYKHEAVFLAYAYIMQEKKHLVNTTPSKYTQKIFLKLGCIDYSEKQTTYMKILSKRTFKYYLSKKLRKNFFSNFISFLGICTVNFVDCFIKTDKDITINQISNIGKFTKNQDKLYIRHLEWVMIDSNKRIFEIVKNNNQIGYIITQYVKNVINNLNYIQILDFHDVDFKIFHSIIPKLQSSYNKPLDFILVSNCNENRYFKSNFLNITSFHQPISLVKSDTDFKETLITSIFGEKGILQWD